MKTAQNNSKLDIFLSNALKNLDIQYQQSDWSEMEPVLGPVHKPIAVNVSKKTILISASALAIIVIGIIISQTVHFTSSSSEEVSPQNSDSSQSLLNGVNTQDTITVHALAPSVDAAKSDSSSQMRKNKTIDSVKIIAPVDTASAKNKNDKEKKQDKKRNDKQNPPPADTSSAKTTLELPPAADTASKHEIKTETPPAKTDSSKSAVPSKKIKKNKKGKSAAADSSKVQTETKPDSLKQQ